MPRSEKQKLKLYYIIEIFRKQTDEDHPISITEIIRQLSQSGIKAERKSIYRDFEAMAALGYEIVPVHSKQFKYYLANPDFKLAELRLLVDAVQASRFLTKKKSNDIIRKLEGLANIYDAERLQSQVYVTNRIKTLNESVYLNVDKIHYAIQDNSKISFMYFDWDINKKRVYRRSGGKYIVSPWALIWNNENYYLIGYESETQLIKHYRVDRMASIDIRAERRDGRKVFSDVDIPEYARKFFGMYNGDIVSVTLNCADDVTNAVMDKFGPDVKFEPQPDGKTFNITVDVAISPVFLSWVFMFGGKVKILSPNSVADELREMAEKIANSK